MFFILWLLVVMQVFGFMGVASRRFDPPPWGRAFVPVLCFVALSAAYEVVFLRWNAGQTPGKQYFGVRVVHDDGRDLSLTRAAGRWALPGLVVAVWPVWAGATLLALTAASVPFARGQRAIHDVLAGTRVVRYVHETADHADTDAADGIVGPEPSGLDTPLTVMDVLAGRPTRRPLRGAAPRREFGKVNSRG